MMMLTLTDTSTVPASAGGRSIIVMMRMLTVTDIVMMIMLTVTDIVMMRMLTLTDIVMMRMLSVT